MCVPDNYVLADSCCLLFTHSTVLHIGDAGCWELCPTMRTLLQPSTVQLTQSTTQHTSVTCGDECVTMHITVNMLLMFNVCVLCVCVVCCVCVCVDVIKQLESCSLIIIKHVKLNTCTCIR